ncbi:hypothetical protein M408DRAFT_250244 [Serendipita vermifera MAFF 305830]|uniref:Cytochrome P450 n=1 Tax=Serendipita vermifera MAFF 305830 TaxID=933852 RepID=A0A0C2X2V1_SERVB|nr:hypothetical protein M408DRAFT_250244 [Serendipita vermifera MAFF 305830]
MDHYLDVLAHSNDSQVKFTLTVALVVAIYGFVRAFKSPSQASAARSPPGPPQQFLLGNLRQFPQNFFYKRFWEWKGPYGDIVSVNLPGVPMVVLGSYEVAHDYLDKRPNATSGRYAQYMLRKVMGWHWGTTFQQPGPHHSIQRKLLRRGIGPQGIASHNTKIEDNANKLMLALEGFEGNPYELVLHCTGQLIIEVTYGTEILKTMAKELSSWNHEALDLLSSSFTTFWLVDIFHFLRFVPSWIPGAKFKRIGVRSTWLANHIREVPFAQVKELYKSGKYDHSLATDLLEEFTSENDIKDALGTLYSAGADSTTSAIIAFFHAMLLFPEVAQKIYDEIVTVTDGIRTPRVEDRQKMPFTEAVWKETFRWNPFLPLGMPHIANQDEIVNGYVVKAGTAIHANNWAMMMDPKVWGDPERFRPERFLEPGSQSLPNPLVATFGYGMRVCPGMYLADRTGFHVAASLVALYDLVPLKGQSRPDPASVVYTDAAFRLPIGFECCFLPRSQELLKTIRLAA